MTHSLLLALALAVGQTAPPLTGLTLQAPVSADDKQSDKAEEPAKADDRYSLMKLLSNTWLGPALNANKIQVSGWTDASFTGSSASHEQLPMGFNYRANDFMLQQNWLRIDRPVDTDAKTATFGFRSDTILPGSDYRFTVARGLLDSQLHGNNGNPDLYGIDPIQFYGEGYFPNIAKGLDIKVGRFFAQYGVESNDAPSNALLSHAYTFLYDPFTHTGALATLKLNDDWTIQSGLVLGSDIFINRADNPTFIGGAEWAPSDGKDSVAVSVILGCGRYDQADQFRNPEVFDFIYTHKFNDKLNYTFEGLYGFTTNVPAIGMANWLGAVNYLTYQFAKKVSATTRLEFYDDFQGQRTGFTGLYTVLTAGISWKPTRAITLRPEVRYDYNNDSRPFSGQHSLFTAAADLILRW